MKPVILTSDSVCDLSEELCRSLNVKVIPLTVVEGEETFQDGVGITPEQIYERYEKEGLLPKTTAISPQEFLDFFGPLVEEGYEVVHLDISAKLSGTYQNACIAAGELGSIHVIDTCHLSTSMGLMLMEPAEDPPLPWDAGGGAEGGQEVPRHHGEGVRAVRPGRAQPAEYRHPRSHADPLRPRVGGDAGPSGAAGAGAGAL